MRVDEAGSAYAVTLNKVHTGAIFMPYPDRYLLLAELNGTKNPLAWGQELWGKHVGALYLMSSDLAQAFSKMDSYEVRHQSWFHYCYVWT